METVAVSTVTPVYRGAKTLPALVHALAEQRDAWERDDLPIRLTESIFVDDGSIDGSAEILAQLAEEYHWVHPITLARNFGQHPATIAGALHASGDWIVTLDEDLQHQPKDIVRLLYAALTEHADVVYARPHGQVHQKIWYRDLASRTAKRVVAHMTGNPHIKLFNSFRLVRGAVARAASSVSVHDTFFDMLLSWFTDRVTAIELPLKDLRADGHSNSSYDITRLLSHTRRLMLSARVNYLRFGAALGVLGMLVGTGLGLYTLILSVVAPQRILAPGWSSLFVTIVFFGGLSALLIGVLFEYFSTVLHQAQGKPAYFVIDRTSDNYLRHAHAKLSAYIDNNAR